MPETLIRFYCPVCGGFGEAPEGRAFACVDCKTTLCLVRAMGMLVVFIVKAEPKCDKKPL